MLSGNNVMNGHDCSSQVKLGLNIHVDASEPFVLLAIEGLGTDICNHVVSIFVLHLNFFILNQLANVMERNLNMSCFFTSIGVVSD